MYLYPFLSALLIDNSLFINTSFIPTKHSLISFIIS